MCNLFIIYQPQCNKHYEPTINMKIWNNDKNVMTKDYNLSYSVYVKSIKGKGGGGNDSMQPGWLVHTRSNGESYGKQLLPISSDNLSGKQVPFIFRVLGIWVTQLQSESFPRGCLKFILQALVSVSESLSHWKSSSQIRSLPFMFWQLHGYL